MIEAIISRVSTGHILSSVKISLFAMSILFQAKASFNWSNSWSLLAARKRVDIIIYSSFKPLLDDNVFTCADPQKREKNCFQGVQKLFLVIYYENFISLHFSKGDGGGVTPGFSKSVHGSSKMCSPLSRLLRMATSISSVLW